MSILLFADDTNLFCSNKDLNNLETQVVSELKNVVNWLKDNQLTINVKKTNYILFKSPKKQTQKNIKIVINDYELKQVENCKFLGVIIDENLTWKQHILYITDKIAKSTGILSKIRPYISNNLLITL